MADTLISQAGSAIGVGTTKTASAVQSNLIMMQPNDFMTIILIVAFLAIAATAMVIFVYRNSWIPKRWPFDVKLEYVTQDKKRVIRNTNGRIIYDRAEPNEFRIKGGKYKHLHVPIPPDNCKEIKAEGRYDIVGIVLDDDNVVWTQRRIEIDKIKAAESNIEPISQNQRANWVNQNRKAERDKVTSLGALIMQMLPFILLIIVMCILFIFWKNITTPSIQAIQAEKELKDVDLRIIDKLNVLYKIQNGSVLTPYDQTVFNDTFENRFNSQPVVR